MLLGVLRGHKRGVWCVRFSPVDRVLLSSSADCTVKLWAVEDLTCIKVVLKIAHPDPFLAETQILA
jgi:U3 small nucleolar RNA-associated protein 13